MPRKKKIVQEKSKDKISDKGEFEKKVKSYTKLRGMKDVLFDEYKYWDLVYKKASDLANYYGYKKIETPVLEKLELYERSSGKGSDIVTKEMYTFLDKNGEKVALRPEATPGLVRAYIEHGMFNYPQPVKMFFFGPLLRHEKPQSGRYRQHTQFDLEIYGEAKPAADAQLILIAYNFFRELQIETQIQINSIGCTACRPDYTKKLMDYYKERGKRTKLCQDCKKRMVKNPLRLLDCKEELCVKLREGAPQMVDSLCDDCKNHFIKVLEYMDDLDLPYNLNPYLVRGLDYYNRTVFEFWPSDSEEGRQISLGGGGRYDGLVEYMGGRPTPACGFGLGVERTIMKIKEKSIPLKEDSDKIIFIAQLGDQAKRKAMLLFEEMRRAGFEVRQAFTKDNLKNQLEEAGRLGTKLTLILGQKEVLDGTVLIRDMESSIQEIVDYNKVRIELEKRMKGENNSN
jgi:histidyl-tRNA synthetase